MNLRSNFLLLLFCLSANFIYAQTFADLIVEGDRFYEAKDYIASLNSYERAFELNDAPETGNYYNAACTAALAKENEKALNFLTKAIDTGWTSLKWMLNDADLASLHAEPRWQKQVDQLTKIKEELEKDMNKSLMAELEIIREKDQRYRGQMRGFSDRYGWSSPQVDSLWVLQAPFDSLNTLRVIEIIEEYGYPGKTLVGDQASSTFLVIQHADLEVQEKYLPILVKAAEAGELQYASLALLIDRVNMRNNKPQIYGSQLQRNEETGGWIFYSIEDEKNVNKRREKVGLGPLEDYAQRFGLDYTVPKE
jgi:hypothetical protein